MLSSTNFSIASSRLALESQIQEQPEDERLHSALALTYAGLGWTEQAIEEGLKAVELMPVSRDALRGPYPLLALAWTYAIVGEHEEAIETLERYLSGPGNFSLHGLLSDPRIDPLRSRPRFQALLEKYEQPQQ